MDGKGLISHEKREKWRVAEVTGAGLLPASSALSELKIQFPWLTLPPGA